MVSRFVEELAKTVLELDAVQATKGMAGAGAATSLIGIPTILRDSLSARLASPRGAKEVAQIGAAVGREFVRGAPPEEARLMVHSRDRTS
jgi:hypothetical protein